MLLGPETESATHDTITITRVALAESCYWPFWVEEGHLSTHRRLLLSIHRDCPTESTIRRWSDHTNQEHLCKTWNTRDGNLWQWPSVLSRSLCKVCSGVPIQTGHKQPLFPSSNGEAERAVGTIKELLKKSKDPYLALLAYRTTPLEVGYSPSQLLMSRILRSTVPTTRTQRAPRVPDGGTVRANDRKIKTRQKENFDIRHGARELPPLEPGDTVWLPDRRTEATVQEEVGPQSFQVESADGSYRRNRRDIIRLPTSSEVETRDSTQQNEPTETTSSQPNEAIEPRRSSHTSRPPRTICP